MANTPELVGRTTIGYWGQGSGQEFLNDQCQETCRDLNHTKMGTTSIMCSAEYAFKQGIDIWKKEQERLADHINKIVILVLQTNKIRQLRGMDICNLSHGKSRTSNMPYGLNHYLYLLFLCTPMI